MAHSWGTESGTHCYEQGTPPEDQLPLLEDNRASHGALKWKRDSLGYTGVLNLLTGSGQEYSVDRLQLKGIFSFLNVVVRIVTEIFILKVALNKKKKSEVILIKSSKVYYFRWVFSLSIPSPHLSSHCNNFALIYSEVESPTRMRPNVFQVEGDSIASQ